MGSGELDRLAMYLTSQAKNQSVNTSIVHQKLLYYQDRLTIYISDIVEATEKLATQVSPVPKWPMLVFLISMCICLTCSSTYHLMYPFSYRTPPLIQAHTNSSPTLISQGLSSSSQAAATHPSSMDLNVMVSMVCSSISLSSPFQELFYFFPSLLATSEGGRIGLLEYLCFAPSHLCISFLCSTPLPSNTGTKISATLFTFPNSLEGTSYQPQSISLERG